MSDPASKPSSPASGGRSGRPAGSAYPPPVDRLIHELARLPGIGRRSAERLAFHLLKAPKEDALALARAVAELKQQVRHCSICYNLTETDPCVICADPRRDRSRVLVVEQPRDLIAIEQTGMFRGVYHILMGRLSPLDGIEPEDLTIAALLARAGDPAKNAGGVPVVEVILGLNPTLEGDGTASYLHDELARLPVEVTRLARGLPTGGSLEFANKAVLSDAIEGRRRM
jgi:recombination protein RecR